MIFSTCVASNEAAEYLGFALSFLVTLGCLWLLG